LNSKTRTGAIALLTGLALFALLPTIVRSDAPFPIPPISLPPVYGQLDSRIETFPNNFYQTFTLSFSVSRASDATVFISVGTFIPAFQCCPGAYLAELSIDSGPLLGICGGVTSQFTNVLNTLTCFIRHTFAAGQHTVTLVVFNGGGTWTVEAGPTTAILIQFG
jgi:hypothetical protein